MGNDDSDAVERANWQVGPGALEFLSDDLVRSPLRRRGFGL